LDFNIEEQCMASGVLSKTSQISVYRYREYFETLLKQGDVLHIAFGSGMTQSVNNAWAAAKELKAEYPDRKLAVIRVGCGVVQRATPELFAEGGYLVVLLFQNLEEVLHRVASVPDAADLLCDGTLPGLVHLVFLAGEIEGVVDGEGQICRSGQSAAVVIQFLYQHSQEARYADFQQIYHRSTRDHMH